ncbi:hypothetical protein F1559_004514 [Cyanidiococcus yangmingshanensis]|uniref:phosphatidate cytidylyltransferase n=1 Tax=Cyanidiococcus yangmingshanensis TaxID=2690220 RepID=A0A7J7IKT8_9RHOD|nr:hypothetical protein F1559_004514 [Cyanidiococcus yangmingshanensis]
MALVVPGRWGRACKCCHRYRSRQELTIRVKQLARCYNNSKQRHRHQRMIRLCRPRITEKHLLAAATTRNRGRTHLASPRPCGLGNEPWALRLVQLVILAVRVASGVVMGLVATTWILAGTWVFTVGLTAVAVLGQLEYYNMVRAKGIRPAQRAGIAASVLALWVAAAAPLASEAVFPVSATLICTYMLLHRREKFATIADISTTFMGMFYAGYLPTFWVRMRSLGGIEQTRFPACGLAPSGNSLAELASSAGGLDSWRSANLVDLALGSK